jgi:hypothetical protein
MYTTVQARSEFGKFAYTAICIRNVSGLDINVCPIVRYQWKLTSDKWKNQIPKRAGTTDKSISTSIKYWVLLYKRALLICP